MPNSEPSVGMMKLTNVSVSGGADALAL
jgi:hypothetical protein